ncbi:hypothetical protein [Natronococcus amylolyticus]|uniref:hypothetical protein n=1 Tax=Natronococcus amylolyticus TaxID=44470 RepID=UPI001269648E|nr:hypothetical protein [Natronococcus amylolyticus]
METKGVLYIATGKRFAREAAISAESIKKHMPHIDIAIMSNEEVTEEVFDEYIKISNPDFDFSDQIGYILNTPFDRTLCIDTDIYADSSFEEVFDLLDEFDIAAAHNQNKKSYEIPNVPDSFPEYNTGVLLYKNTPRFRDFIKSWKKNYDQLSTESETRNQPAFRRALYCSNLRIATLPSEYNLMVRYPGHAVGKVKIFHGRLLDIESPGAGKYHDVEEAAKVINSTNQHRVFTQIGGISLYTNKEESTVGKALMSYQRNGLLGTITKIKEKL